VLSMLDTGSNASKYVSIYHIGQSVIMYKRQSDNRYASRLIGSLDRFGMHQYTSATYATLLPLLSFFFIFFNRADTSQCRDGRIERVIVVFFGIIALFRGPFARHVDVTKPPVAVCVTTFRNWQQMGSANGL